jgi:hypothetical protein
MSKLARTLILGVALAAMNLAGMTAVAQAQSNEEPARRPPTERQVGEPYRDYYEALAAQEQATEADAVERFRRGERASQNQPTVADTRRPPTEAQVGESWRHPATVPVRPAEPSGQPDWLVPGIGVLAVALALSTGLAVLAARRTNRGVRAGQSA